MYHYKAKVERNSTFSLETNQKCKNPIQLETFAFNLIFPDFNSKIHIAGYCKLSCRKVEQHR